MTTLIGFIIFILFCVVIVQIAKFSELASQLRGEEHFKFLRSRRTADTLMVFLVLFMVGVLACTWIYRNYVLGFGPHEAASEHGNQIDSLMKITLALTGVVFVATHVALFYFAWKYRERKNGRAEYISHDNKLEVLWTVTPSIAMVFLVINGIMAWDSIMADVEPDEEFIEVEATGMQFSWLLRYPGSDAVLGNRDFRKISGVNPLGQDWTDVANLDDIMADELVLPKGKKVRVRITARDVLHNFYLPHFRLKMDAVPGMPTYFVFTPKFTTEEYRQKLKDYKEYQVPSDPDEPNGPMKWETFEYELACAELCGNGHYSMRKIVKIVEPREYEAWLAKQKPYYLSSIRNSDDDPYRGQLLDVEVEGYARELSTALNNAIESEDKSVVVNHIEFRTGSSELTPNSAYQIANLAEILKGNSLTIELGGHTDNTGDPSSNVALSLERAEAVKQKLVGLGVEDSRIRAKGYGSTRPIDSNDNEEGRAKNRRTEITIL